MSTYTDQQIKQALADWPVRFKKYAQSDNSRAILQIITSFGPFFIIWALMYQSLQWSYWITWALALLNAFFTVRIFIIQHDCGHRSYFKDQSWNRIFGWIGSLFTFIPFQYWAQVHDFHHGHSGQLEVRDIGDIQTLTVKEYAEATPRQRFAYRIFRMPLITFVIGPVIYLIRNNRFTLVKLQGWQNNRKWLLLNNIFLFTAYGLGCWLLGWKAFLMVQLPIVFLFAIIAVWFFFVQHQHEMAYKQWRDNWDYLLSAIRGSSFYKLPGWLHFLTGNIGYHHIHHLNSRIPSYNLIRCAKENPDLQQYVTSVTFFESLKFMFHKLWDEQTERMITFKEFHQRYGQAA